MTIVESNATVQEQATSATEGLKNRSSRNGGVSEPLRVNGDRDRASLEPSVELAAQAQHVGDLNAALAHWQRIREQFPEDPRGYSGCGAVLRNLNRLIDAESVLHEGSRKFPSDQNIADTHAWVAHSSGDLPEANRRWTAIRASFPHSFAGYFGGGAILRAMRRFDEADEIYRLAFARFPASSVLLADFASVAQARGDLREASRRWIVLNTLFPNQLDGFLREARALREAGLYGEAENVAADALKCFPGNVTALIESAQIAQQRGHGAEALRRWEAVITDFPGLVDGYTGAARALNELGRFADAQNVLQPAVRKFPDSIEAASLSARTEHYLGKFPEAAIRWKAIRERFPTQTTGYIGGAESLLATGNTEDATELVETASRIFPEDLHVAMQFARVAELAQNWNEAVRRWKAVVERFPDRPAVIAGYALSLSRSGISAVADKILEAAIAQPMSAIELYQAYAECASQRRDWPVAAARWRHSVDIFPDRVNAWTGLGESLRNAGRLEESANLLTAALQRYPDNVELERQIAVTASAQRAWTVALPLWEKL
jgi:tetratricopeptide (TPR) repeat protein